MAKRQQSGPRIVKKKAERRGISCLAIISDIHAGCRLSLCPPGGILLDDGGEYVASDLQIKLWQWYQEYLAFVDRIVAGRPLGVIMGGDAVEGVHHRSVTQISHNLKDQLSIAKAVLKPLRERANRLWVIRGTEAHVGPSALFESFLGEFLHAEPSSLNIERDYARWELNLEFGPHHQWRINDTHHVSATANPHFVATALNKEIYLATAEAQRWGRQAPHIVSRHHRHTTVSVEIPWGGGGMQTAFATPCWQLKGPFIWRTGARIWQPQCGAAVIESDDNGYRVHHFVRSLEQTGWEKA